MTDSTTTTRVSYTGDGSSTNFTITFPFYLSTDILVQLAGATVTSGYSISGGNGSAGTLVMATPPASGVNVQAILNPPLTQSVNLVDGTSFPSATLNQVNDRAVQIGLRLQDQINRSARAPDGDAAPAMLLPTAANRANKSLMFDSNGNITTGVPNTQVITTDLLAPFLNLSRITAEITAGVTPTNYAYAPGMVDRYGTNTAPGTTDMTNAIQRAIAVATASANLGTGGVVTFLSATYLFTSLSMATNVQLVGQGHLATVLTTATAGNGIAMTSTINQAQGVRTEVRDLQIICTNGSNTGGGYVDVAGTLVRLRNVRIQGFSYNVIFDQSELALIERCDLQQPLIAGLWIVNGADHTPGALTGFTNRITVRDTEFNSSIPSTIAVIDDGGTSHTFHDNNYNGFAQHFRIAHCTNLVIRDSEFELNTGYTFVFANTTNKGTSVGASSIVTIENNFFSPPSNQLANVTASSLTGLTYICNRSITSASCISGTSGINTVFAYGNLDSNVGTIFDGIAANHFETAVSKGTFIISDNILSQSRIGLSGQTPAAIQSGFGSPTGAALTANFPGATATLAQTSGMVAEILAILKAMGLIGA